MSLTSAIVPPVNRTAKSENACLPGCLREYVHAYNNSEIADKSNCLEQRVDNRAIARKLLGYANFLEGRESSVYRVRAYRRAAQTVLSLDRPVSQIVATDGRKGLESLPGIGRRLS